MSTPFTEDKAISAADLAVSADELKTSDGLKRASEIYREHGALHVRGLMKPYLAAIQRDIEAAPKRAISNLDRTEKNSVGWSTPDGTLFIPAPEGLLHF